MRPLPTMRPLAALLLTPLLLTPGVARAHAILMDSEPAAHATVAPGQTHLVLRYNSRIDQARSRLELRGGPAPVVVPLAPSSRPDTLTGDAALLPGEWVLRWQVLAVDGHITRGDVPITVKAP